MGGSQRPGRDGLLTLQSLMSAEGKKVSIAKLCRWFDVPRSTFYYESKSPREPVIDEAIAEVIRKVIEENPAYGVRRITVMVRRELNWA